MQIQPINNNYNTNFKAIKELRYKNEFVPHARGDHRNVLEYFLASKGIKEFAEKYDFLAEIDVHYKSDDIYNRPYRYILKFLPAATETAKKIPKEFTVAYCKAQYEYEANDLFSSYLKNMTLSDIEDILNSAIAEKNQEPPREKSVFERLEELGIRESYVKDN